MNRLDLETWGMTPAEPEPEPEPELAPLDDDDDDDDDDEEEELAETDAGKEAVPSQSSTTSRSPS